MSDEQPESRHHHTIDPETVAALTTPQQPTYSPHLARHIGLEQAVALFRDTLRFRIAKDDPAVSLEAPAVDAVLVAARRFAAFIEHGGEAAT